MATESRKYCDDCGGPLDNEGPTCDECLEQEDPCDGCGGIDYCSCPTYDCDGEITG